MKKLTVLLMSAVLIFAFCFVFESCTGVKEYTVTFNVDGEEYKVIKVAEGASVELPTEPTKEGYIFIGWYLGEEPFLEDTAVTGNLSLDAVWEEEGADHTHRLTHYFSVSPTCTADGRIEHWFCILCKKSYTDVQANNEVADVTVVKKGHSLAHREAVAKSCTTDGSLEHWYCSTCRKCYSDANAANELSTAVVKAGHPALTHHSETPKGCATDGNVEHWNCPECEKNFSDSKGENEIVDVVLKASHSLSHQAAIPASCTKDGYKEYWHCSVCKKKFSEETALNELKDITVPAKSHAYNGNKCTKCGDLTDSIGLAYEISADELSYTVVGIGTCTDTDIVIPAQHEEKPVTQIASQAFLNKTQIISVKVPNSVTNIGLGAFEGCTNIEKITLPFIGAEKDGEENTHLGYVFGASTYNYSFHFVPSSLKTVIFTGGNSIRYENFYGCSSITSIEVPDSIINVDYDVFDNCANLKYNKYDNAYYLGNSSNPYVVLVKAINSSITSCKINSNTKVISYRAFADCFELKSIEIPDSVVTICEYAFDLCYEMESVKIGNGVETIAGAAFIQCYSLDILNLGSNVKNIGNSAFYACSINNVTFPNGLKSIGSSAFYNCDFNTIEIPDSVTSIGKSAFSNCPLTSIKLPFIGAEKDGTKNTHFGYIFGASSYSNNYSSVPSNLKTVVIKSGTVIPDYAFYECKGITSIQLPDNVESFGDYSFYRCIAITESDISDSVKSIGDYAFYDCVGITSIKIPDGVKRIESLTFGGCSGLESVIMSSVEYIGSKAFSNCTKLTNIEFSDSLKTIENYSFENCSALTSIEIPEGVENIGDYAFYGCTGLYTEYGGAYYLSDNKGNPYFMLIKIKEKSIVSFEINNNTKIIASGAFQNCVNLMSIEIPYGVTNIEDYAFEGCASLISIELPDSVKIVGARAFSECSGLISVVIGANVIDINPSIFYQCYRLVEVINKSNLNITTDYAFEVHSGESKLVNKDDFIFYTYEGINYLVTYLGDKTELVLPQNYNEEKYVINDYAFMNGNFTSVSLGTGITRIENYAFLNCNNLNSVYINDIVAWCGIEFQSMSSTPFNYARRKLYIDDEHVVKLKIPEGVERIGKYAFACCTNLLSVELPSSLKSIEPMAFDMSINIVEVINKSELDIKAGSFEHGSVANYALKVHNEESKVVNIDEYIFYNLNGINYLAYYDGDDTILTLPQNFNGENYVIRNEAFSNFDRIVSVIIPDSVTKIEFSAFSYCLNLTSVTIGSGVTEIDSGVFSGCSKLVEIINRSNLEMFSSDAIEIHNGKSKIVNIDGYIFYMRDGINYLVNYIGDEKELVLPENYNGENYVIGNFAFEYNHQITSVIIPDCVTRIGDYAFEYCTNLERVTIGYGVSKIGCYAFIFCDNLQSAKFRNPLGWVCFYNNNLPENFDIPSANLSDESNAATLLIKENVQYWWLQEQKTFSDSLSF